MAWIHSDPECGYVHDEFGGTHVYEDGHTLASENPNRYWQVPWHAALLLDFTSWLNGLAARYCGMWKPEEKW